MGTSVSRAILAHARTFAMALAALALALGLVPATSLAADAQIDSAGAGDAQVDSVAGPLAGPGYEGDAQSASPDSNLPSAAEGPTLASAIAGSTASIVSADVALDAADPIVGSFTADGMTYALNDGKATLISVGATFVVAPYEGSADSGDGNAVAIPSSVTYDGVAYDVVAVGPYAFYLSGATSVELPNSIASVDSCAFRSSDVGAVTVDQANPTIASFDGCLYDSQLLSLLLIPEGRAGAVLLPKQAEVVQASKFSHCSLVDAISVGEGGAAFASWDGLLYDASGTTLLRVPAGATDIAIKDGCTAIAAGAMEGCAKLERIDAPASVTSISPYLFESVPTVSLPIASALQDGSLIDSVAGPLAGPGYAGDARSASADSPAEGEAATQPSSQDEASSGVASGLPDQVNASTDSSDAEGEAEVSPRRVVAESQGGGAEEAEGAFGSEVPTSPQPPSASSTESADTVASTLVDQVKESTDSTLQLTAMVALSTVDDDLPEVDPSSIEVALLEGADEALWQAAGFSVAVAPVASAQEGATSYATYSGSVAQYLPSGYYFSGQNFAGLGSPTIGTWGDGAAVSSYWYATDPGAQVVSFASSYVGTYVSGYWDSTSNTGVHSIYSTATGQLVAGTWYADQAFSQALSVGYYASNAVPQAAYFKPTSYSVTWHAEGGAFAGHAGDQLVNEVSVTLADKAPSVSRSGYRLAGWAAAQGGAVAIGPEQTTGPVTGNLNYYAVWERVDYGIGFDTSSEPGDVDYPGDKKDDQTINVDSDQVLIEDPKRPGYVFEGWVIPNDDGTEAVDQELVYQGSDGKWYVDASKLPGYAGDDGRVELTARWTSVISVDVPSSVTFYADLVTQGQESREGAAEGAFGQSKVENQSEVDLRIVGLESSAVPTTDSTLGADSILKKADAATPSTSTQKLLSLYPSAKQWTADELQDPDAVGGSKAAAAVDFDLDDVLLEKSFKADDFTIAAGGTLNMGYRLNLAESGQELDYDKLATLAEGQSASIANVSYTFAGDALPSDWGEPLWIENPDRTSNPAKYLLLDDIKVAADDLSANGTASQYYATYKGLLDAQVTDNGNPGAGPYFQLKVDGVYLPLQLIGICQDAKTDGTGKAGLTFQMRDVYAYGSTRSTAAGGGTFNYTYMNPTNTNSGGWGSAAMRSTLRSTFWGYLPAEIRAAIVGVDKCQQLSSTETDLTTGTTLQKTTGETIWLPSMHEVFGASFPNHNNSEALTSVSGYAPFQYMAYEGNAGNATNTKAIKTYNGSASHWWLRSAYRSYTFRFCNVHSNGDRSGSTAGYNTIGAAPCFCL